MKRLVISLSTAAVVSFIIFLTLNDFGITWDEPIYMQHGDAYVSWLKQPNFSDIDKIFRATTDDVHPPLRKLIAGITHEVLTTHLRLIDNTRGYRISSLLFVFPFITALTYIAIGQFGYAVGLLIPFMFSLLPHVLFLTPLVTLDYAVAALWFMSVMAVMKDPKNNYWLVATGVIVGLSLLTKLNGYLLFIPVGGFVVWHFLQGRRTKDIRMLIVRLGVIAGVACLVYVVGWPWLWTHTFAHLAEYFRIQTSHVSAPVYIFGKIYDFAPWWYTPVMFFTTTPVFTLVFFAIGAYWSIRKGKVWDRVMVLNALYPLIFFSLPGVYRYDWVRLFLSAFPFVCLVAGRGIVTIVHMFGKKLRTVVLVAILAAWFFTVYASVIRIHPWESAYYNEFVGGVSGAKKIGMESEFWGNAYLGILPWMNVNKKHLMCVAPTTNPFYYYQAMGQIEPGVVFNAARVACDYYVILMRQSTVMKDPYLKKIITTEKPVYAVLVDGVTLVGVYDITKVKD